MTKQKSDIIEIFKEIGLDHETLSALLEASPSSPRPEQDNKSSAPDPN